jgi:hypothetical protein
MDDPDAEPITTTSSKQSQSGKKSSSTTSNQQSSIQSQLQQLASLWSAAASKWGGGSVTMPASATSSGSAKEKASPGSPPPGAKNQGNPAQDHVFGGTSYDLNDPTVFGNSDQDTDDGPDLDVEEDDDGTLSITFSTGGGMVYDPSDGSFSIEPGDGSSFSWDPTDQEITYIDPQGDEYDIPFDLSSGPLEVEVSGDSINWSPPDWYAGGFMDCMTGWSSSAASFLTKYVGAGVAAQAAAVGTSAVQKLPGAPAVATEGEIAFLGTTGTYMVAIGLGLAVGGTLGIAINCLAGVNPTV